MATLRSVPHYLVELHSDELKTIHKALHLLGAHPNKEFAEAAKALAAKLAKERHSDLTQRLHEMEKLMANIEKGVPPAPSELKLLTTEEVTPDPT
jgi:putative NADPH-quinone reductase